MSPKPKDKPALRSTSSYGGQGKDGCIHRSWMKSQGLPADAFDGRPVIGICNTWSELTPCNTGLRDVAEHVTQAECGCDFDFLAGASGSVVERESH